MTAASLFRNNRGVPSILNVLLFYALAFGVWRLASMDYALAWKLKTGLLWLSLAGAIAGTLWEIVQRGGRLPISM